jgi:hypothetical protein
MAVAADSGVTQPSAGIAPIIAAVNADFGAPSRRPQVEPERATLSARTHLAAETPLAALMAETHLAAPPSPVVATRGAAFVGPTEVFSPNWAAQVAAILDAARPAILDAARITVSLYQELGAIFGPIANAPRAPGDNRALPPVEALAAFAQDTVTASTTVDVLTAQLNAGVPDPVIVRQNGHVFSSLWHHFKATSETLCRWIVEGAVKAEVAAYVPVLFDKLDAQLHHLAGLVLSLFGG